MYVTPHFSFNFFLVFFKRMIRFSFIQFLVYRVFSEWYIFQYYNLRNYVGFFKKILWKEDTFFNYTILILKEGFPDYEFWYSSNHRIHSMDWSSEPGWNSKLNNTIHFSIQFNNEWIKSGWRLLSRASISRKAFLKPLPRMEVIVLS